MVPVLYEDRHIMVVEKPIGVESQASRKFSSDMVSEIKTYLYKQQPDRGEPYVGVVHRLDKPVGGIMVYGKNRPSTCNLSRQIQQHRMIKRYVAVVCGKPVDNRGVYVDYLLKDGKSNCSKIVDKCISGGKVAELSYQVVDIIEDKKVTISLLQIELKTGRHHQIRVQMAHHGTPIWGDYKYNAQIPESDGNGEPMNGLGLAAFYLEFLHPVTNQNMVFQQQPKEGIFMRFKKAQKGSEEYGQT